MMLPNRHFPYQLTNENRAVQVPYGVHIPKARRRRRRVSRTEIVLRSKLSLERLFGRHRGQAARVIFCIPFLILGLCALGCFLFTRICIRTISWIGLEKSVRKLRRQLNAATNAVEYESVARELDIASGCEEWKSDAKSSTYDWRRVASWTKNLRALRLAGNHTKICELLTTIQHLKYGRVFCEEVFSYCHWGTKRAIESFFNELEYSLSALLQHTRSPAFKCQPCPEIVEFVRDFSSTWGRTALCLSGGGMIGFHHFGVGKALLQLNLIPDILVGCSAGSAVAAWLASRTSDIAEKELEGDIVARVFSPFEQLGFWSKVSNLCFMGHLCTKEAWLKCARRIYADTTLLEAYNLTGRVLNISACRADETRSGDSSYMLNFRTAPNVTLTSAILASSAFPLLTAPFTLTEKLPNGDTCPSSRFLAVPFRDGSLSADVPLSLIAREFDVGFSIVVQVNPHVYPFLGLQVCNVVSSFMLRPQGRARAGRPARKLLVRHGAAALGVLGKMEEFFREVMGSILRLGVSLDVWPTIRGMNASQFLNQTYQGDVTLLPRRIFWSHRFAASNITRDRDLTWYLNEGMVMAFEKVPLIRARLTIERVIVQLVDELGVSFTQKFADAARHGVLEASSRTTLNHKLHKCRRCTLDKEEFCSQNEFRRPRTEGVVMELADDNLLIYRQPHDPLLKLPNRTVVPN